MFTNFESVGGLIETALEILETQNQLSYPSVMSWFASPSKSYILTPLPPVPQNVTLIRNRVIAELVKMKSLEWMDFNPMRQMSL